MTKREAVKKFLEMFTHPDLARMYTPAMECQVNVAQDNGERVEGEYEGRKWQGWTNGMITWKSFRIPFNAAVDPTYTDSAMSFPLDKHVEAIGMTGWDWENKVSRWVGFDFDSIVGHSERANKRLTQDELTAVEKAVAEIPWVQVRKSTGGRGLHLYVFLEPIRTETHTEHAAVGRAILGKMSALAGFDFESKADVCGGNMWVWHRKMSGGVRPFVPGTDGLSIIKEHTEQATVPVNWRDHVKVVTGRKRKISFFREQSESELMFESMTSQHAKIPLDEQHRRLLKFLLEENRTGSWWDQDNYMLVTHTYQLARAYDELSLTGIFTTISKGDENGTDHNCWAVPLRNGAWCVRRYGQGTGETETWSQDGAGYTRCFLNQRPDLPLVSKSKGAVESTKGGFHFKELGVAIEAVKHLGVNTDILNKTGFNNRPTTVAKHKDGRIVIEFKREDSDSAPQGWLPEKGIWRRIFDVRADPNPTAESEVEGNYDDLIRHLVSEEAGDSGWVIYSDGEWRDQPLVHVKAFLKANGLKGSEAEILIGQCVSRPWTLVNMPFREEYPGERKWNRKAAQFRFVPSLNRDSLHYPTWSRILNHLGRYLNDAVAKHPWCIANAIAKGGDYLKVWIASMFQFPLEPLPYLFFYSEEQDTGKSSFHESLELLMVKGYQRADNALISPSGFNAEIEGSILCVVEETDLSEKKTTAYNRIKDWVTARNLPIHRKGETPYHVKNSTHWVQTANAPTACPIFPGDTRVIMVRVDPLDPLELIPKKKLIAQLEQEAPDFLAAVLSIELPPPDSRLNIPILSTEEKIAMQRANQSPVQRFLETQCFFVPGATTLYSDVWDRFKQFAENEGINDWTQRRFGQNLPQQYPKGRISAGSFCIGNMSFDPDAKPGKSLTTRTDAKGQTWLVERTDEND